MKAIKDNKQYTIDESEVKRYTDAGYDIVDNEGKVIKHGKGKTVSYEQYAKAIAENESLRAELAECRAETEKTEQETKPEAENVNSKKKTGKKAGA